MIIILIRTIILYFCVVFSIRLMGKSELSELQPFELAITLIIAELAVIPMENTDVPLLFGFVAIGTLMFIQISVSYLTLKSEFFRRLICGKPSILIENGYINFKELKRLRLNLNDLIEQTRSKGFPYLEDINYAILETDGTLSIIPKAQKETVTLKDMKLPSTNKGIPITLILDGKLNSYNLNLTSLNEESLIAKLRTHSIFSYKEVLLCYITENNYLFVQTYNSQIINFK